MRFGFNYSAMNAEYSIEHKLMQIDDNVLGGCRNSSPAGKRRVPGAELLSLDSASDMSRLDNQILMNDGKESAPLAVTAATTLAVAICLASVAIFATIFIALQVIYLYERNHRIILFLFTKRAQLNRSVQ